MHVIKDLPNRLKRLLSIKDAYNTKDKLLKYVSDALNTKNSKGEPDPQPIISKYPDAEDLQSFLSAFDNESDLETAANLASQVLDGYREAIAQKDTKKQTLTSPSIDTAAVERGNLPPEYQAAIKAVTGGDSTSMDEKITKLNEISEKYSNAFAAISGGDKDKATKLLGSDPQKILQELMVLDLFNLVLKGVDAGSGPYYFEALLALLAGGSVVGKELTASGQAGAADYKTASDGYGSAKFYKQDSAIKQSKAGFVDLFQKDQKPVEVDYVVGLKKAGAEQVGSKMRGISDPSRVVGIEIYQPKVNYDGTNFTVTPAGGSPEAAGNFAAFKNGKPEPLPQGEDVYLTGKLGKSSGTIFVVPFATKTFREYISDIISARGDKDNVRRAVEAFRDYFDMLEKAEQSSKKYVSSADAQDSKDTTDALSAADDKFTILVDIIKPNQAAQPVSENKMTELNLMVENMVKHFIKGNLND